MYSKIYDCITFFRENFITNLRFEILKDVVDYHVVCESSYDHKNNFKGFNFKIKNNLFRDKIIYIQLNEPFTNSKNPWVNQAFQRDFILQNINAKSEDYLIFSDPDEIMRPEKLINFNLKKKYGIFLQKHFMYKFNIIADQYSPWEGSRVVKFGDIKSIDYLRQKILVKNIKKWWRPDKEKSIQIIEDGGWHFNNFLSPEELAIKLNTFAHTEFSDKKYSDPLIITDKIANKKDLFGRGHVFRKLNDKDYDILPDFVNSNLKLFRNYFD
jgi:beta-1,4-mannosyl-glycoprotein beta-1,4-N-acetylglucosaminyltransferase